MSNLRGMARFDLRVKIAHQGSHTGLAGGIVPDTFSIIKELLSWLEPVNFGELIEELQTPIPEEVKEEAKFVADRVGHDLYKDYHLINGAKSLSSDDIAEMYLNNIWRPCMHIVGIDGINSVDQAANIIQPETKVWVFMRISPNFDPSDMREFIEAKLTKDVPYNAEAEITYWTVA